MNNYCIYHLHSDLSNAVTNIDSTTKYFQYIERAKECGMNAMAFSEHGSVFEWWHKKSAIEAAGMKYIHAVECYLTTTLAEKIRDNYHCVLLAKNHNGFLELNRLVSNSFCRKDNHMSHQRMCSRAYHEYQKLFDDVCNALRAYSEEWAYLVDHYFMPKCEYMGFCKEKKSCGKMPHKE